MPNETKGTDGYTDRQRVFIREYVRLGERNGTEAAKVAGYSESSAYQRAHELLHDPRILEGIAKERREQYQSDAVTAQVVLRDLLNDTSAPISVRKDIALAIIDRAGDKHSDKVEVTNTLSPEKQAERIKELHAKLMPTLRVVNKE